MLCCGSGGEIAVCKNYARSGYDYYIRLHKKIPQLRGCGIRLYIGKYMYLFFGFRGCFGLARHILRFCGRCLEGTGNILRGLSSRG